MYLKESLQTLKYATMLNYVKQRLEMYWTGISYVCFVYNNVVVYGGIVQPS
jgi:hypothetical protein